MLRRVILVWTDASVQFLVTANVLPSLPILVALMMVDLRSSKTLVLLRATQRNTPEDGILHSHKVAETLGAVFFCFSLRFTLERVPSPIIHVLIVVSLLPFQRVLLLAYCDAWKTQCNKEKCRWYFTYNCTKNKLTSSFRHGVGPIMGAYWNAKGSELMKNHNVTNFNSSYRVFRCSKSIKLNSQIS
jgi:hypothetical protein